MIHAAAAILIAVPSGGAFKAGGQFLDPCLQLSRREDGELVLGRAQVHHDRVHGPGPDREQARPGVDRLEDAHGGREVRRGALDVGV